MPGGQPSHVVSELFIWPAGHDKEEGAQGWRQRRKRKRTRERIVCYRSAPRVTSRESIIEAQCTNLI